MKVLFICKANVGRSQMAEAFFNRLSKKNRAKSAGAKTGERRGLTLSRSKAINVIKSMKFAGFDISANRSKQLTRSAFDAADKVIVMTERENMPEYARKSRKVIFWKVPDPRNKSYRYHVMIRNLIKGKVQSLVRKLE